MHFGDSIFIFLMALVLFGPKRLPEIGRQVGKLLAEFRRASNEFKFQIQEELRTMEEDERRKKLAEAAALKAASEATMAAATPASPTLIPATALTAPAEPVTTVPDMVTPDTVTPAILPPATGEPISAARPYATPVSPAAEPTPLSAAAPEVTTPILVDPLLVDPPGPTPLSPAPDTLIAPGDASAHTNGAHPSPPETQALTETQETAANHG